MKTTRRVAALALLGAALCAFDGLRVDAAPQSGQEGNQASPTTDPVFGHPLDSASRPMLESSFGNLARKGIVGGEFVQTKSIKRLGRNLVSKGEFLFSAKDGVYWKILSPYPSTIILTTRKLVQRSSDGTTSVIDASDNAVFEKIAGTMQAVFSGGIGPLEDDFSVYFEGDASSWRLGLVPKEKSVRGIVASLVVEGSDTIASLRLVEGHGDVVTYAFSTVRAEGELTEEERGLFVF